MNRRRNIYIPMEHILGDKSALSPNEKTVFDEGSDPIVRGEEGG
jgi:hypothetical protein